LGHFVGLARNLFPSWRTGQKRVSHLLPSISSTTLWLLDNFTTVDIYTIAIGSLLLFPYLIFSFIIRKEWKSPKNKSY
jgi:hypothetical protein